MRVIIAGGRDILDYEIVKAAVENSGLIITEVVSGCATGVDTLGERWAEENGVPVKKFPANWNKHGKAAGGMRNGDMAAYARGGLGPGGLVAVWDGVSRGTRDMIAKARLTGLEYHVERVEGD